MQKNQRKILKGVVVSNKMNKTVTVMVQRTYRHHYYQKVIRREKKFYAHYDKTPLEIGQQVCIKETRPLSKLKRWIVVDVLS